MGETPRADYRLAKGIEALVFDQFIDPENLQVLPNEQHRTVILLLALTVADGASQAVEAVGLKPLACPGLALAGKIIGKPSPDLRARGRETIRPQTPEGPDALPPHPTDDRLLAPRRYGS